MDARAQTAKPELPIKRLRHQELVDLLTLLQSDPDNRELEDKLLRACLEEIRKVIEAYVFEKRIPNLVIDEAISSVQFNLTSKLRKVRSPSALKAWLIQTSRGAAVSAFLKNFIGRSEKGERVVQPLEVRNPAGELIEVLDLKDSQEAVQRYKS